MDFSSCLRPPSPLILGGFAERRCFNTLKLLPHDQTSKYLPGQQRATPRQLTMQHLNISRMQSGWYTGEEMGGREKREKRGLDRRDNERRSTRENSSGYLTLACQLLHGFMMKI